MGNRRSWARGGRGARSRKPLFAFEPSIPIIFELTTDEALASLEVIHTLCPDLVRRAATPQEDEP